MNRLTIKNLTKTYAGGVRAMNDISLELSNGMFGLLGPNGAGKSTSHEDNRRFANAG
jgi:ABC-2 type transport system ATP-binding protein